MDNTTMQCPKCKRNFKNKRALMTHARLNHDIDTQELNRLIKKGSGTSANKETGFFTWLGIIGLGVLALLAGRKP